MTRRSRKARRAARSRMRAARSCWRPPLSCWFLRGRCLSYLAIGRARSRKGSTRWPRKSLNKHTSWPALRPRFAGRGEENARPCRQQRASQSWYNHVGTQTREAAMHHACTDANTADTAAHAVALLVAHSVARHRVHRLRRARLHVAGPDSGDARAVLRRVRAGRRRARARACDHGRRRWARAGGSRWSASPASRPASSPSCGRGSPRCCC